MRSTSTTRGQVAGDKWPGGGVAGTCASRRDVAVRLVVGGAAVHERGFCEALVVEGAAIMTPVVGGGAAAHKRRFPRWRLRSYYDPSRRRRSSCAQRRLLRDPRCTRRSSCAQRRLLRDPRCTRAHKRGCCEIVVHVRTNAVAARLLYTCAQTRLLREPPLATAEQTGGVRTNAVAVRSLVVHGGAAAHKRGCCETLRLHLQAFCGTSTTIPPPRSTAHRLCGRHGRTAPLQDFWTATFTPASGSLCCVKSKGNEG